MKTISFYISDYGYGHVSRSIALIRDIVNSNKDINIIVKISGQFEFTKKIS